jgi:hypothetical protein
VLLSARDIRVRASKDGQVYYNTTDTRPSLGGEGQHAEYGGKTSY